MMKKIANILIITMLIFSLSACKKTEFSTTNNADLSDLLSNSESTLPFDIENADMQEMDIHSVKWTIDGSEELDPESIREIIFEGNEIHLNAEYSYYGKNSMELGVFATLGGVRQKITVIKDGKKEPETQMYIFTINAGETVTFDVEFTPDIGKKGETLELELSDMSYPSYLLETSDPSKGYNAVHIGFDTQNIKVIFDADSECEEKICSDYSGIKVSDVDPLIKRYCREEDDNGNFRSTFGENLNFFLYKESPAEIFDKDEYMVMYSDKEVDSNKNQPMTINLSGIEGRYRVAFYVNHTPQPVFDGCRYTDVTVDKNKQTEVAFKIDTTTFGQYNHCYYTVYKIQDDFEPTNLVVRSATEKFIVNQK